MKASRTVILSALALGVQEAPGDPMSDDPANIYVTRHRFAQGENFGRLVCAIFVNDPHFVEVTVHPEDDPWVPPTPAPAGVQPAHGIGRDEAVRIARDRANRKDGGWSTATAEAGSLAKMLHSHQEYDRAAGFDPEHWVWRVSLTRGSDQAVEAFVDYVDGTVLGTVEYIVN